MALKKKKKKDQPLGNIRGIQLALKRSFFVLSQTRAIRFRKGLENTLNVRNYNTLANFDFFFFLFGCTWGIWKFPS